VPGYEVVRELGRGGMGVVYQARQTKLGRVVALKMILSGGHAGEADRVRFRTEAEAIARLQHSNIVQIFEVGEQGGLPYFSLEFCGGGSLERKLTGTPLPAKEAAALVEQLARAMQAAHQKGIVHRDLKPANVLLAEDGTPKVTDFGLAKRLDEAGQTATGAVMGTPSYMAPEQAGGKSKEIGPAADVYALGAILYECLTGRPPFRAATAVDTLMQVVADDPVPPSRLAPRTPRDVEIICLKCLQKEPHKRYAGAEALADDLRHFLEGEPITARPVGLLERAAKWVRRRPAAAALVAVSAAAALGFVLLLDRARREATARSATEAELRGQAEIERDQAAAAREESQDTLARSFLDQARVVRLSRQPGRRWQALDLLRRAEQLRARPRQVAPSSGAVAVLPTRDELRRETAATLLLGDAREESALELSTLLGAGGIVSEDGRVALRLFLREDAHTGESSVGVWLTDLEGSRPPVESPVTFPFNSQRGLNQDGTLLAVVSENGSAQIISLPDGKVRQTLPPIKAPGDPPTANSTTTVPLRFSGDGRYLLALRGDAKQTDLLLWNRREPSRSRHLARVSATVSGAAFTDDANTLAYPLGGNKVAVTDLAERGDSRVIELPLPPVAASGVTDVFEGRSLSGWRLGWVPGTRILVAPCVTPAKGCAVVFWDVDKNQELARWEGGFSSPFLALGFHPGGKGLVAGDPEGNISCFDLAERRETLRLEGAHPGGVGFVRWLADGRLLSAGVLHNVAKVWKPVAPLASAAPFGAGRTSGIAFSRDGRWLVLLKVTTKPSLLLLNRRTGQLAPPLDLGVLPSRLASQYNLVFRPDGGQLALVSNEAITVWDVPGWHLACERRADRDQGVWWSRFAAFLDDGRLFVARPEPTDAGKIRFRTSEIISGREVGPPIEVMFGPQPFLRFLADAALLSDDGKYLIVLPTPGIPTMESVRIWDVGTGEMIAELKRPDGVPGMTQAALASPDNRWLAQAFFALSSEPGVSAPTEMSIRLWDVSARRQCWRTPPSRMVNAAASSPDSRLLAAAYSPSGVEVWDVSRGEPIFRWDTPGAPAMMNLLAFAPDGTLAASDGHGPLWTLDIPALRHQLAQMGLDW
jgi:WD40 repeat protein